MLAVTFARLGDSDTHLFISRTLISIHARWTSQTTQMPIVLTSHLETALFDKLYESGIWLPAKTLTDLNSFRLSAFNDHLGFNIFSLKDVYAGWDYKQSRPT
jgi:hypothetical protein